MSSNRRRIAAQRKNRESASQNIGEADFVAVAKVRKPHGLKGEVLLEILTDFPGRIVPGEKFRLGPLQEEVEISSVRPHTEGLIVAFSGYANRDMWKGKRNLLLFTGVEDLPQLGEDEFYHHQLINLVVQDQEGKNWGKISEIIETGANDVYVAKNEDGSEYLIPATTEVVLEINLEKSLVKIQRIPGLFPD